MPPSNAPLPTPAPNDAFAGLRRLLGEAPEAPPAPAAAPAPAPPAAPTPPPPAQPPAAQPPAARPAAPSASAPRPSGRMAPGAGALALIHAFEGCARALPDGRFAAYPDPASGGAPWTIGWGSTGPDITRALIWTRAQCDARLTADLARLGDQLAAVLGKAPTGQNQFDALAGFAYNLGLGALRGSTLLRLHGQGDFAGAAAEFARWNRAGGRVMAGLTRRRAAEAALYATPDGQPLPAALAAQ